MTDGTVGQEQEIQDEDAQHVSNKTISKTKDSNQQSFVGVDATTSPLSNSLPKSSVRSLSRRSLSTIPAAKPDGFWFQRGNRPYYPRFELPSNTEDVTDDARLQWQKLQSSKRFRLRQTIVSLLLSVFCYACLLFTLPTLAWLLWLAFRKQTGGVIPLPGDNTTQNETTPSFELLQPNTDGEWRL